MYRDGNLLVYDALALATRLHDGQMDKTGQPYIMHPTRVGMRLWAENEEKGLPFDPELIAAGFTHDIIEDTYANRDILFTELPLAVIDAIEIVSRVEGETYQEFIHRIANTENRMAIRVKLADLADNLDPIRTRQLRQQDPEKAFGLRRRYLKAHTFLQERLKEMDKDAEEAHLYGDDE